MSELEPEHEANEQKRRAQEQADDLRWMLSGPRGRRIAWRWLESAGVFRTSFNTDALAMAFANLGPLNTQSIRNNVHFVILS